MKKMIFAVIIFVSLVLIAEETNWISQSGWVTGPGSQFYENQNTYLLPFAFTGVYTDDHPLLYETDMGWPVPNEDESELKYLFFGDTKFFMRDNNQHVVGKITDLSGEEIYNFNIEDTAVEIEKVNSLSPLGGKYLNLFTGIIKSNYDDCFVFCTNFGEDGLFNYFDFEAQDNTERCQNFCMFDMIETYASAGYFLYDYNDNLTINGQVYNNGTSNVFLAAELDVETLENEPLYKVKFKNIQNTNETGLDSAQVYSTTDSSHRKSKSIWMNSYERRELSGTIGIYPRGYFYACAGSPSDGCQSKKMFVPYTVGGWDFLDKDKFCQNAATHQIPSDNNPLLSVKQKLKDKFEYLDQSIGSGIYDFENECRIKFSKGQQFENPFSSIPICDTTGIDGDCHQKYPNKHILWSNLSKMSNLTVVHGVDRDLLSINDGKDYIYFMGTGETNVDIDELLSLDCDNNNSIFAPKDATHATQKAYIARVLAYESEIKCAASYEYFAGITNGIARWTKDIDEAESLYGFYPLASMGAESIVKHRDLYWMTAPLNETTNSELEENKKGFVILASPDAMHWQKVDTVLFENPDSIQVDYAFFWLPPNLIATGDNTMPFLYSVWKSNGTANPLKVTLSNFLDDEWDPKFTHYNLKAGKYKFMEKSKTRAFLLNTPIYDSVLTNTIPGKLPIPIYDHPFPIFYNSTVAVPFTTFQNLYNLNFTDEVAGEREQLKKRYVIIEYCYCGDLDKKDCTNSETGLCKPFKRFVTENGVGEENWKIIEIKEDEFFNEYVSPCKNGNENIPDYMCNIPFEHGENLPKGIRSTPVWKWRRQIKRDYPRWDGLSANVILRFSHWNDLVSAGDLAFEQSNYTEINRQLMENNKLIPYDCDGTGSSEIISTCQDPSSWRTTKILHLKYRTPEYFVGIDSDKLRLEYLYPYPVMIHDFGKPGDPAPDVWDMLTADHFAKEFFKVSSFEYADSSLRTLTSGAAATAVIKNGQMQIYAWGGTASLIPRSTSLAGILYVGTYNPETEVVTFMSEILDETDTNSPALTAGASMVYDDENDKIYLIGAVDQNGISRIYRLEDARTGRKWESVATIDLGRYFRLVKKSEHEYFAFGGQTGETSFNTKVYLLDLNNMTSPRLITNIPAGGLANSFAAYSEMDQKLYIFGGQDSNGASSRFLSFDTKTAAWSEINVSGGPGAGYGGVILVDYITETISLGGGVFENSKDGQFKWIFNPKDMTWTKELKSGSYCLKETGTTLQGGLEFSGECVPFTHQWYNSFSAGATVYSLDGKSDRLFVGTNNAIKIYDISDPTSPVLVSSFSTSSRVNDLEVYGNTLFAATNGGLYKLDASNDTLTQTLFVSAFLNSQYKVEVYNGKLYVGDDNGIKVRDLETLSVLTSVNNGSVLDFAIENGEIGLYKDDLFSPVEIRDAETLTLKANEFFGCFEIEVGSSDGRFYLSCDDETYRFEDDGDGGISFTELSGDIRELQDVYTFDGYTYFYDENTIWISTSNDVPALCGNGIVEGDEVCDGGQIDCEELDSSYVSGTATCNSTCDGYNTNNCSDDGW